MKVSALSMAVVSICSPDMAPDFSTMTIQPVTDVSLSPSGGNE